MVGILAFILIGAIIVFVILYRNASGQNLSRYVAENTSFIYDKFAPYTYSSIRDKIKDLGYDCEVIDYQCESIIMREVPQPFRFSFNPKRLIIDLLINYVKLVIL